MYDNALIWYFGGSYMSVKASQIARNSTVVQQIVSFNIKFQSSALLSRCEGVWPMDFPPQRASDAEGIFVT